MNKTFFKFIIREKDVIVINKDRITYLHESKEGKCDIHLGKEHAFRVTHSLDQVLTILGENDQAFKPAVS